MSERRRRRTIPPWVRLGQNIGTDDKFLSISYEARWLYVASLGISASQLLDGAVPESAWAQLGCGPKQADELVDVNLWVPLSVARCPAGVDFDKWDRWQEPAWKTLADREKGRAAAQASRDALAEELRLLRERSANGDATLS